MICVVFPSYSLDLSEDATIGPIPENSLEVTDDNFQSEMAIEAIDVDSSVIDSDESAQDREDSGYVFGAKLCLSTRGYSNWDAVKRSFGGKENDELFRLENFHINDIYNPFLNDINSFKSKVARRSVYLGEDLFDLPYRCE